MALPWHLRLPLYVFGLLASIGVLTIAGMSLAGALPIGILRVVAAHFIVSAFLRRARP